MSIFSLFFVTFHYINYFISYKVGHFLIRTHIYDSFLIKQINKLNLSTKSWLIFSVIKAHVSHHLIYTCSSIRMLVWTEPSKEADIRRHSKKAIISLDTSLLSNFLVKTQQKVKASLISELRSVRHEINDCSGHDW